MKAIYLLLLGVSATLNGYTPPADFILAEMAKHCVSAKATFDGIVNNGQESYKLSLVLQRDGLTVTGKSPVLSSQTKLDAVEEKVNLSVLQYLASCQEQGAQKIKDFLAAQGVDVKKVGHVLYKNAPGYSIGADAGDGKSPQIWVEKQNFFPILVKDATRTISFENWISARQLADKKWPSIIRTTVNGKESTLAITAPTHMLPRK